MKLLKNLKSIRVVLTLWYSVVLLVAFVIFGATIYIYLRFLLDETLKQNLVAEIDWISRLVEVEVEHQGKVKSIEKLSEDVEDQIDEHFKMNPRNYIVMLSSLDGKVLYESESRGEKALYEGSVPPRTTLLTSLEDPDLGTLRVAARRSDPLLIQVAYTENTIRGVLKYVLSILTILIPVVLIFSFSGGWLLAGMVLRPIKQVSAMANRITAENLDERIPPRKVEDELGKLIETINRMIERLQASFSQIRQFSLNIAHELRTPLTILKGESELALGKPLSPAETQELARTYLEETVRLSKIVDDLLTLAKAEAGQISIQHEPVQLQILIEELYEDALILTTGKNIRVELVRNEPLTIIGDPVRLRQLFRNLIMNAVQYTDSGGRIRISSKQVNGVVEVEVDDTGIGIPAEALEHIFQPFYRVDPARSRSKGGSGLGLSISKWVAEAHKGSISVKSKPGGGSSFTVTLPLRLT
jgi:two-component system OmpR family sensor kinase